MYDDDRVDDGTDGDAERRRLATLHGYGILDTPAEPEFDDIVREAASILGTPIALISLIDTDRQWFKAKVGLDVSETPRSISFCSHAICGPGVFVVEDATKSARFADNPLVTGRPDIRFYAGSPLKNVDGVRIGTLCVLDNVPHKAPTSVQKAKLAVLADRTIAAFEARRKRQADTGALTAAPTGAGADPA